MKSHSKTSRRAFFVQGSATLGAGVATVAGAGPHAPGHRWATPQDAEAIRQLHLAFVAGVETQAAGGAHATHRAYRANAQQIRDALSLSADGQSATAAWHVDVKVGSTLEGDSTAAQMARLQGMLSNVHWETGTLHARYEKSADQWRLAGLRFEKA